ncbi:MAG: response regulator [Acidimicrobiia bacterium]
MESADLEKLIEERTAELARSQQAAIDASRARGEFLANMSHEIRTPMNAVIGLTELLLDTPLLAEQRGYVENIRNSANALLALVNDVLDFSKIESGKVEVDLVDVDLVRLVNEVTLTLASSASAKWLTLEAHVAPEARTIVRTDPTRVRQVLVNLIGNAIKFTEKGSVTVVATKRRTDDGAPVLRFDVMDTGIGISEQVRAKLFKPFQQGDLSTTRKYGGTGLGLAISTQLLQLLHGKIDCEGEPGKGSTFWFEIPFEPGSVSYAPPSSRPLTASDQLLFRPGVLRVLLAEDNPVNQMVASKLLEKSGMVVETADNGLEALNAVMAYHYDLVVMDCQMPEMDGFEATRRIRSLEPGGPTRPGVPILALTANALDGDRERCLEAGMTDYLAKSVDRAALSSKLTELMNAAYAV